MKKTLAALALISLPACSDDTSTKEAPPDAAVPDLDAALMDSVVDVADSHDAALEIPRLGVYTVNVDGTGLSLVTDPGTRQLSHVRPGPDGWITATRYAEDVDGNGLAMEGEGGMSPHYGKTEVVVFHLDAPQDVTIIAGGVDGRLCANSSWTADGKLLFLHQDDPDHEIRGRFKRATFSTIPVVDTIEILEVPTELFPVDPCQWGPSDQTGVIVFSGLFQHPNGFMRPVWQMPASGTSDIAEVEAVGCPLCAEDGGCCAFDTVAETFGTNDPTISPNGHTIIWMHQHPQVSANVGSITIHPYRQHARTLGEEQRDLTPIDIDPLFTQSYVQWRADGEEVVYWAAELDMDAGAVKNPLYRMAPDGSNRQPIPLPEDLCSNHPAYLNHDTIIFSGWRCGGPNCSCATDQL